MTVHGLNLTAMFVLGFLGTGHCLGMCGPLVVALPGRVGTWSAHLLYHAGRIGAYAVGGGVRGALGGWRGGGAEGGDVLTGATQVQLIVAVFAVLFLLLFGLNRLGVLAEPAWLGGLDPQRLPGFGPVYRSVLHGSRLSGLLLCGLMLGLLPCGLSYAAFAAALASGGFLSGGLMCLAFGLGTLPGLLALGSGLGLLIRRFRRQTEMIAGLIMIAMALFLSLDIWAALTNGR